MLIWRLRSNVPNATTEKYTLECLRRFPYCSTMLYHYFMESVYWANIAARMCDAINFVSKFMHLLSTTVLERCVRPSTSARVPFPSMEIHYRGESIVTRLHARLNTLHALDLPKRGWRHLPRHMTILTLLQNVHGDRLRRNTRGTYRIIIRRNRPLLPRKHFRGGLHDAENGGESCELRVSLGA